MRYETEDDAYDRAETEKMDAAMVEFRKWYDRANKVDVIDFNSAYQAWMARAK
jgi:hypothetical protein